MCRHLGYLGPPRTLHDLVYAPPHALHVQSWAPRMNLSNVVNADGFGVGWYVAERAQPVRYRRAQPMWTDVSFADLAEVTQAQCAVAAVRSATTGFPVDESGAQPLREGRWLFSHNGRFEDFAGVEGKLRELAGGAVGSWASVPEARAPFDSALLFAFAVGAWRSGRSLGDGLADVVATVAGLAPGRFNLLAADGQTLAATRYGDTLFVNEHSVLQEGSGTVIASEPYDDAAGWREVPDHSLVTVDASGPRISPL